MEEENQHFKPDDPRETRTMYKWIGAVLLGFVLTGYITRRIETGHWNPLKQHEYARSYDKLWAEVQSLANKKGERCCDGPEIAKILKRFGYQRTSSYNPTMGELELAREGYKRGND